MKMSSKKILATLAAVHGWVRALNWTDFVNISPNTIMLSFPMGNFSMKFINTWAHACEGIDNGYNKLGCGTNSAL